MMTRDEVRACEAGRFECPVCDARPELAEPGQAAEPARDPSRPMGTYARIRSDDLLAEAERARLDHKAHVEAMGRNRELANAAADRYHRLRELAADILLGPTDHSVRWAE